MKAYIAAVHVVALAASYMSISSFLTPPKDYILKKYDFTKWSPAGPHDARSPCPVLNSLANHYILPHDGKNLTISLLQQALPGALNLEYSLATVLATGGLFSSPNFWDGKFSLSDLNKHNFIEHDGSISRADFGLTGDGHSFNHEIFNEYMSVYKGSKETSIEAAARGRQLRMDTERSRDPDFTYGLPQHIISYGETVLVLSALRGGKELAVPVEWLDILWREERFPFNEGWRTATEPIGFGTVHDFKAKLVELSGGMGSELALMGENFINRLSLSIKGFFKQFYRPLSQTRVII
ncbi:Chloroperoxidase [Acrodontium crateriforme]|uniref:Chloroperoxidase n=1 Tax=Acrodontium crateriforme TaxID=150365 RepID=A0AAQ3LXI2_9PEZI|nr:Chloroperoxidase [Acrodontium crateriforme]